MHIWNLSSFYCNGIKSFYTVKMDYDGSSFKAIWNDGLLIIKAYIIEDNSFALMKIILEAAIEQDTFNLAWDLRSLESVSTYQIWKIVSFASQMQPKLDRFVTKTSILITPKYEKTLKFIMKFAGPSCPCYVGTDVHEAKRFLS